MIYIIIQITMKRKLFNNVFVIVWMKMMCFIISFIQKIV